MPQYFPDLESVKSHAELMQRQTGGKKYKGLIPKDELQLSAARLQLGAYMRNVWKDEVAALEIELSLTEDNYYDKLKNHMKLKLS